MGKRLEMEKPDVSPWAWSILEAIEDSGLSQSEIARRAGVSAACISYFCNGLREPYLATAYKVCTALGLSLIPGSHPPPK